MKRITAKQIHEIARELEAGMKVFVNRQTLEFRSILEWDDTYDSDHIWAEELQKIHDEWPDYIVIAKMESQEAFRLMQDFASEVEDASLRRGLTKILSRKSPFANFKYEVETSSSREQWFDFRIRKYEDYVKQSLELENIQYEPFPRCAGFD